MSKHSGLPGPAQWHASSRRLSQGHLLEKAAWAAGRGLRSLGPQSDQSTYVCMSLPPGLVLWSSRRQGHALPARPCIPRKQEELVQQVRKRLEEALMADMLAHVEELARDGEVPLDKPGADEDEDEEEEPDQDQDMEHI